MKADINKKKLNIILKGKTMGKRGGGNQANKISIL